MSLGEFIDLITITDVVDDNFGAREIGTIFNLSMMTQVDEINKERHCRMSFVEFLEAVSRVADRVIVSSNGLANIGEQQIQTPSNRPILMNTDQTTG